ncbi:hypothetical protein FEM48_Zijuj03G0146700 [Ziziphus jujuba var. spinosa]|uniref:Alpha/beta hydrolase fold-3 domain-containing protein n=1 Tax=Ziziphus jujuba var. spinosa TaxID=714518 RepID=A0A978VQX0_ZIZJJ|nr:hypothetical protein FEM48_Zijuj03G0146700 [Ziziphus jujuba var. spinosa]
MSPNWRFHQLTHVSTFFSSNIYNTMSDGTEPSHPIPTTIDPYEKLQIVRNADGTITRLFKLPETPASSDPNSPLPVFSKDIPINQSNKTWARIYLPRLVLHNPSTSKLPIVVVFHGGGFVFFSAASTLIHDFCVDLANEVPVIIASVEYRLAPEHRLPAAYDDAMEALYWIRTTKDEWLREYADLSNCFLMGGSAGANIAYHAGLRAAMEVDKLEPLKIKGLILQQPFFGGTQRTESEMRLVNDPYLPVCSSDLMWELSLPIGVDRDHEYCNATVGGGSEVLNQIRLLGWRIFVNGWDGDQLIDRQTELVKMLESKNVKVVGHFREGGYHGADMEPPNAKALHLLIKSFISDY